MRVRRGERPGGGDVYQPVLVAVQQQHRHVDVLQHGGITLPVGESQSSDWAAVSISESTSGYLEPLPCAARRPPGARGRGRRSTAASARARPGPPSRGRGATRRPTTGTMKAANVAKTLGSGRARRAGGSAGVDEHEPRDRSRHGVRPGGSISPPIELPIRTAGVPTTSTRKRCSRRLFAWTDVDRAPPRVCPKPARSMATTRQVCASVGATAAQLEGGSAEAVHRRPAAVGRATEVEVVHRTLEQRPSATRGAGCAGRVRTPPWTPRPEAARGVAVPTAGPGAQRWGRTARPWSARYLLARAQHRRREGRWFGASGVAWHSRRMPCADPAGPRCA